MNVEVLHEPGRFFARIEGLEAEVVYERQGDVLDIVHTWTPPALRGQDVAARITEAAFAYARTHGLHVIATCPYTRAYVAHHPELHDVVVTR